ncbi:hypothetical protein [Jiella sp. M17.18]|uniref:hypothetical protein n=1 Tax=Jiella sp. M17.18 TaxID=3234247 RepID=UPI0034DF5B55
MTLSSTASDAPKIKAGSLLFSPLLLLGAACVVLAALLTRPFTLPIGANYWDLYIYFDAANRIFHGQVPGVDFFTPVGPLGYWLFALFVKVFPQGQPLLVVQWSLMLVTVPLFALVLADVDRRSRTVALALLVPFLVFQILPFNITEYYSYPGVDGFGIYNRQICEVLYVLSAALIFATGRRTLLAVIVGTMLALFLIKITGFVAGLMLCVFAFAVGRVTFRAALVAAGAFFLTLLALQLSLGIVTAYFGDILALLGSNEDSLLPRFLQAASLHFKVLAPLLILTLVLLVVARQDIAKTGAAFLRRPTMATLAASLDRDAVWLGLATFAALFVETQNTGGQGFIFVWPILLSILVGCGALPVGRLALVWTLVAASSLPTFVDILHRSARAFVGQMKYVDLADKNLGTLGAISQRTEIMRHAKVMMDAYAAYPATFQYISDQGELPNFTLYTEPDFQVTWLMAADQAVDAIRAYEAKNDVHFDTIMSLNFVNPFPWLMNRDGPHAIAIGADPFRAVPDPDAAVIKAVTNTDLILYPLCPITDANETLKKLYEPGLAGHVRVHLSPCWDGFVRDALAPKAAPAKG